jgi:methyl coenzyme M reductase gamma subunit
MQCDERLNDKGEWVDSEGQKVQYRLATEKYQAPGAEIHPMSAFARENTKNYFDSKEDILER